MVSFINILIDILLDHGFINQYSKLFNWCTRFDSMYLVYIDPYTWYFNQQTKYMKICDFGMPLKLHNFLHT